MKRKFFTGALFTLAIGATMTLVSCGSDDPASSGGDGNNDDGGDAKITQAILVYMNAENNLSSNASADLAEMLEGSKSLNKNTAVYAFVDQASSTKKPYIEKIYRGDSTVVYTYDEDFNASDPSEMTKAIQKMIDHSEASDFSMILWGHGTGSLCTTDTVATTASSKMPSLQAYGYDSNNNTSSGSHNYWINTPALARVFTALKTPTGTQMKFQTLFCDCCCMQNTENAYEFRNNADYYVALASETPGSGANYTTTLSAFNKSGEDCAKAIIDTYVAQFPTSKADGVCIAAVRLSQMDNLLNATNTALQTIYNGTTPLYLTTTSSLSLASKSLSPDPQDCIFYAYADKDLSISKGGMKVLYDIKDIMRENLSKDAYETWLNAFNQTVFYSRHPKDAREVNTQSTGTAPWLSSFIGTSQNYQEWYRFYVSDETCGSMNTTFPVNPSTSNYPAVARTLNERHFQLQWWQKVWKNFGF